MIARKKFKVLGSSKLPNGSFISVEFGTELEEECEDSAELMDKVYKEVYRDLKKYKKTDPIVGSVWEELIKGLKQEKKLADAE